jgi:hypothetical protein
MNKSHLLLLYKPARVLFLAWVALLIAACGAGTGGTGTGPQGSIAGAPALTADVVSPAAPPATSPATPPSTSATDSPPALSTSGDTTTNALSPAPDPRQPVFATWSQSDVSATFEAAKIVITQGCAKFEYAGDWALDAKQQVQVQGTYTPCASGATPLNASLVVQIHPSAQGTPPQTLSVLITDATGQVLIYGPLLARN